MGIGQTLKPYRIQKRLLTKAGVPDKPVFFDVGANQGQTLDRFRTVYPGCTVYCFEPSPETFQKLKKKVGNDKHAHLVEAAVSRHSGTADLFRNTSPATDSLRPRPKGSKQYYPKHIKAKDRVTVPCITLDEFVEQRGIKELHGLKMDVQGGELDVLQGARTVLSDLKPLVIYSEVQFIPMYEGAPFFSSIDLFLSQYGYRLFDFTALHRADNGRITWGDALFISQQIADLIDY